METKTEASGFKDESRFLSGPQTRKWEFGFLLRVLKEFITGFRALHFLGPCVTFFGSARIAENHRYYQLTRRMGAEVSKLGFTIITGGGPGLMEAANRGAKDVEGISIGCNITLPYEQQPNPYLDRWITMRYFFVRKVLLLKYSYAFIVMPGGVGTADELFETWTLIQTGKIKNFPIILMGTDFWSSLQVYLNKMLEEKTISPSDLNHILITDSVEEALLHLADHSVVRFSLTKKAKKL